MSEFFKKLTESDLMWVVAFVGVCVLVYVGKLKPETVEMMLMAIVGRAGQSGLDSLRSSEASIRASRTAQKGLDDVPGTDTNVSPK